MTRSTCNKLQTYREHTKPANNIPTGNKATHAQLELCNFTNGLHAFKDTPRNEDMCTKTLLRQTKATALLDSPYVTACHHNTSHNKNMQHTHQGKPFKLCLKVHYHINMMEQVRSAKVQTRTGNINHIQKCELHCWQKWSKPNNDGQPCPLYLPSSQTFMRFRTEALSYSQHYCGSDICKLEMKNKYSKNKKQLNHARQPSWQRTDRCSTSLLHRQMHVIFLAGNILTMTVRMRAWKKRIVDVWLHNTWCKKTSCRVKNTRHIVVRVHINSSQIADMSDWSNQTA